MLLVMRMDVDDDGDLLDDACRYNNIGDEGAAALAGALGSMTGLQTLKLG